MKRVVLFLRLFTLVLVVLALASPAVALDALGGGGCQRAVSVRLNACEWVNCIRYGTVLNDDGTYQCYYNCVTNNTCW